MFNLSPYLRGPDEWRWAYAIPGKPVRHVIPALTLSMYVALAVCWVGRIVDVLDPSKVIADPYEIDLTPYVPPGDYALETGFYLLETGQQPSTSGQASTPVGRIILTSLSVRER